MKFFIPVGLCLVFLCCSLQVAQGVKCYQCTYIEGVDSQDMNPDCVSDVSKVHVEEGSACLTATGEVGGKAFTFRRAFLPGTVTPRGFPTGQASIACDDYRVKSFGANPVARIGDRVVEKVDSCKLCNDVDMCNAAPKIGMTQMSLYLGISFILFSVFK